MTSNNFKPWVGKDFYEKGYNGKRILILGESHYCAPELTENGKCYPRCSKDNMVPSCHSKTIDSISEFLYDYKGEQKYNHTYVCFERSVAGRELNQIDRVKFWDSVMFYNYIQYSLPGPRIAPNPEYWKKSEEAFKELLLEYKPDYIIVWGKRLLYNGLPDWGCTKSKIVVDNDSTDVRIYSIEGREIPAMIVDHPSCPLGKRWGYWHKFYMKLFETY